MNYFRFPSNSCSERTRAKSRVFVGSKRRCERDEPGGSPPFDCRRVLVWNPPGRRIHTSWCERSEPRFTALLHILGAPPCPPLPVVDAMLVALSET